MRQGGFVIDKRPSKALRKAAAADAKAATQEAAGHDPQTAQPERPRSVWSDADDARLTVRLAEQPRLRKLRSTEAENEVSGAVYESKLRARYASVRSLCRDGRRAAIPR